MTRANKHQCGIAAIALTVALILTAALANAGEFDHCKHGCKGDAQSCMTSAFETKRVIQAACLENFDDCMEEASTRGQEADCRDTRTECLRGAKQASHGHAQECGAVRRACIFMCKDRPDKACEVGCNADCRDTCSE